MTGKAVVSDHFDGLRLNNANSLGVPPTSHAKHAVVVGSINIDTRLAVPALPGEGTTVTTDRSLVYPGGKGANQAAGLAKLGHRVTLVGDVGADASSDLAYRTLEHWGVDTSGVYRKADVETGKAYIFVDTQGASMTPVLSGANAFLSADDLASREQLFEGAQYCLVQTEIPLNAVRAALDPRTAKERTRSSSPRRATSFPTTSCKRSTSSSRTAPSWAPSCRGPAPSRSSPPPARKAMRRHRDRHARRGRMLPAAELRRHFPAADFEAIDTTGASDAFISALAARLMAGDSSRRRSNAPTTPPGTAPRARAWRSRSSTATAWSRRKRVTATGAATASRPAMRARTSPRRPPAPRATFRA